MGEAGRARVVARYAVERLVDDVDALYRSAPGRAGSASPVATLTKAFHAGFFLPDTVSRPDCQPPRVGSSRSRNQSIMSMRGFLRAIA